MQANQPANKSRTESSHLPVSHLPALSQSSHEIISAFYHQQLLYRICMFLSTHCPTLLHTHRLMALKINYLLLSADPFCLYFSNRIHSVLAITFNRPGKGVWYFHTGERVPPGGEGSNVALYLAPSYSRKSN